MRIVEIALALSTLAAVGYTLWGSAGNEYLALDSNDRLNKSYSQGDMAVAFVDTPGSIAELSEVLDYGAPEEVDEMPRSQPRSSYKAPPLTLFYNRAAQVDTISNDAANSERSFDGVHWSNNYLRNNSDTIISKFKTGKVLGAGISAHTFSRTVNAEDAQKIFQGMGFTEKYARNYGSKLVRYTKGRNFRLATVATIAGGTVLVVDKHFFPSLNTMHRVLLSVGVVILAVGFFFYLMRRGVME